MRTRALEGFLTRKRKKLRSTVEKVVRHCGEPEKAQIEIQDADPLYRELCVENEAELMEMAKSAGSKRVKAST